MSQDRIGIGAVAFTTLAVFALTAFVVSAYPELAIRVDRLFGGGAGDGSSLGYFRTYYVLPGALTLLVLAAVGLSLGARRGARSFAAVAAAVVIVLAAALVFSVKWFFRETAQASALTSASRPLPDARVVLPMAQQMRQLGVREALVIASQAVDDSPVWAPDGRYVAANVDGRWIGVEPDALELAKGEWHGGQPIGTVASPNSKVPLSARTVEEWRKSARSDPRNVTTRDGARLELRQSGTQTEFVVTLSGSPEQIRWTTSLESCGDLALSPDDRYVAFVCEQNGVIVATR